MFLLLQLCVCFSLTSHQQLRSYGDWATALSLKQQTGDAGDQTATPGLRVFKLFIHYTTAAPY